MRFLLVILCFWLLEYSLASDLDCSFSYDNCGNYNCMAMTLQLEKENATIDSVKGQHLPGKEQINVQGLLVVYSSNKFLSSDFFQIFPNLKVLSVMYLSVEKSVHGNFKGAQKLKRIFIINNKIPELSDNIFSGADNLETINMKLNGIKKISNKTFAGLTKLELIYLDYNQLKFLPRGIFDDLINLRNVSLIGNMLECLNGDLFKNNLQITYFTVSNNHLSVIGSNLVTNINHLTQVNFYINPCMSKTFYDPVNINDLIAKVAKCTESNKPENQLIEKVELLNKANTELSKKITEQLQQNGLLNQNNQVLQQEVNTLNKTNTELSNNITKINEYLKYCQNEIQKSQFAFKCFN